MLWSLRRLLRRRSGTVGFLRDRLERFHDLVEKNNRVLELIAEAGEMLGGEYIFDFQHLRSLANQTRSACQGVVDDLNLITDGRYPQLLDTLSRLSAEIDAIVEGRIVAAQAEHVLSLEQLDETMVDVVGAKLARLGAVRRRLDVRVPDGFAVSTYACQVLLSENGIVDEVEAALASGGPFEPGELQERARRLQRRVLEARIPRPINKAIVRAIKRLVRATGCRTFAVRSSALGEDG